MCLDFEKYDEAITNYEKVLQFNVDSIKPIVWRNLGATYKNKAFIIQDRQKKEAMAAKDANQPYSMKPEEYNPYIKKSLELFEQALNTKYADDYSLMFDVYELYTASQKPEQASAMLKKLLQYETKLKPEQLADYYKKMITIYDRIDETEMNKWVEKLDKLSK
jgi:tetratricopeptide (TPR) repeat protein